MKPKVWTEVELHPDALARLRAIAEVAEGGKHDALSGAEVAIIGSSRVDDAFLDRAGPGLKMVVRHGIGYDKVNVPAATARGVLAANTPAGPTEGTAEHAVGLMLAVAKWIPRSDRALHGDGIWASARYRGVELLGKTLGLVGYGRIGQRVAEICGLGIRMNVLFYDPVSPSKPGLPSNISRVESLEEVLTRADVVSLHLRLDAETRHLIGEAQLRLMKPDAILINTSRGEVVDEAALLRVLQAGHLRGAGLDVFDPEPASPDNPLFHMDNVVVTPHTASATVQASFRSSTGVVDQIAQVLRGERPTSLIDPAAWPGRVGALAARSA